MNIKDVGNKTMMSMICNKLYEEDKNFINFIEAFPNVKSTVKHVVADVEKTCES